jgi:hypothetical protein
VSDDSHAPDEISLRLTRVEAIVLFDFLSRFSDTEKLAIEDQSEERVLWDMCCSLEKSLHEPFRIDYDEILIRAREKVRDST